MSLSPRVLPGAGVAGVATGAFAVTLAIAGACARVPMKSGNTGLQISDLRNKLD